MWNLNKDENKDPFIARMFLLPVDFENHDNKASDYTYIAVDGIESCIRALNDIKQGRIRRCFIEMSAC